MEDEWKNHQVSVDVTFYPSNFKVTEQLTVKDLPESYQQKYCEFILSKEDKFIFVPDNSEKDASSEEDLSAWNKYLQKHTDPENKSAEWPTVDEWKWRSSIGEIIIKDMHYVCLSNLIVGAVFFVLNEKYELACLNDGKNMIKVREDTELHREFNQQLNLFNYIRGKRIPI